ncbi:hypothetical protein [Halomicrobium sp. LC1Hm]|uniref:hypothetical protein n=1 Tax=Halomicrobium sp. LC1Hm TaxID=2610902 RepID=UPI0012985311|nr:hypothetical protein [Halomicrobium sp. LC1Hm]QGA81365.1 hypothetical protein LC1Hm_0299 [Halomicrobium sp. LC1Hm]
MISVRTLLLSVLLVSATLAGCAAFEDDGLDDCALEVERTDETPVGVPLIDMSEIENQIVRQTIKDAYHNETRERYAISLNERELDAVQAELKSHSSDDGYDFYTRYEGQIMQFGLLCGL